MRENRIRISETDRRVEVTAGEDDHVILELGDGPDGVTMVGSRYDVHRLIIEADRKLSHLVRPWA